jgi:hypothetical protein
VSNEKVPNSLTNPPISSDAEAAVDQLLKETTVTPPKVVAKPNINTPEAHKTISDVAGKELTDEQAQELINRMNGPQLLELARRIEAVKAEEQNKTSQKPRYFTASEFGNLKESDIYDFNVPIKAIDHQLPDFLDIKLKDPNMVARWINLDPRRMGQAIAEGWSYIGKDDLAQPLKVQVNNSADGHYVYADVVAMKLTKEKVYGRIRGNFLKSLSLTKSTLAIHEQMKNLIKAELSSGPEGDTFQKYSQTGAMGVYSPLAGA